MPAPLPSEIQDRLAAVELDTGVVVGEVIRQTDKTLLAGGTLDHRSVVVKLLLDGDDFWRLKLAHEVVVYQAFAAHPPPVRVPHLLFTDDASLLILSRLDGQPLGGERYADGPLAHGKVDAVLAAVRALNAWRPPPGAFAPVLDYPERIDRYHAQGFLTETDAAALRTLLSQCDRGWEFNHGDLLPSNLLMTPDGRCAPLDWEFGGLFLPGFDLAFLHAVLASTPYAQRQIEEIVASDSIQAPFMLNQAMVLTRELRIHAELPASVWRDERLRTIESLWQEARRRLKHVVRKSGTTP